MFVGGGYDVNQDSASPAVDTRGRAIYVVDILTGTQIWRYSNTENSQMKYCVPSDITRLDMDGNGKIDRLYVGDTGGRMWRLDIGDPYVTNWTGKIIFDSASSGLQKKIFYPPDVTFETDSSDYEILFFGTGDREHPKESTILNRLYAVKDKNLSAVLKENDLIDVTQDLLQDPNTTQSERTTLLNALSSAKGWYIKLDENAGEKNLASPVVFYGVAYYSTFTPTLGSDTDICFIGEGTGRLYALNYRTGAAAFNLDTSDGTLISRTDRSIEIGSAIPSGVIIAVIGGETTAYIGVGGGVYRPKLPETKSLFPIDWRIVF
jgi:type IV pilus assembly protein PilY1